MAKSRENISFVLVLDKLEREESSRARAKESEENQDQIFEFSSNPGMRVGFIIVGDTRKGRMSISPYPNFLHPIFVLDWNGFS